jgi:hypothetical protein
MSMKVDEIFPTPIIFPNISNIVIQDDLIMDNESHQTFSNDISWKRWIKIFKLKNEQNNKLHCFMETYKHHSFKKFSNMFYKDNVHPILNT